MRGAHARHLVRKEQARVKGYLGVPRGGGKIIRNRLREEIETPALSTPTPYPWALRVAKYCFAAAVSPEWGPLTLELCYAVCRAT